MTTTDLKPGDIVQHPEHGYGVVLKNFPGVPTIYFAGKHGYENTTRGFTGWERVETCTERERTILDSYRRVSKYGYTYVDTSNNVVMEPRRSPEGSTPQRAESTPPADEQPANATVTLPCPDCGELITNTAMVELNREGDRYLDFCIVNVHTCQPAQPDEPTEFGARVSVTLPDGTREKWCRLGQKHPAPWLSEGYGVPGEEWRLLCGRGTVTIGWDE